MHAGKKQQLRTNNKVSFLRPLHSQVTQADLCDFCEKSFLSIFFYNAFFEKLLLGKQI